LALIGLQRDLFGMRPLDIARYAAAITLMWASIEKWAYPEWTFPLLTVHPSLTLGFNEEFFMRAAGVIEFTLSFALLWTPLVRRASAIVLAAMFTSATFEFGQLDVIGHAPIVVVLLAIIGDDVVTVTRPSWSRTAVPAAYCVALAGFLTIYYVVHALLFGTHIA
jgi:vacuolar-type H+-ATPase subunit I/STV1